MNRKETEEMKKSVLYTLMVAAMIIGAPAACLAEGTSNEEPYTIHYTIDITLLCFSFFAAFGRLK